MNHPYKQIYREKVAPALSQKFGYKNPHQLPTIIKIQVNRGLGLAAQNKTVLQKSIEELRLITGQQPIITRAKKSIAGFKIREEMELGVTVTLRKEKMYSFLERLINLKNMANAIILGTHNPTNVASCFSPEKKRISSSSCLCWTQTVFTASSATVLIRWM